HVPEEIARLVLALSQALVAVGVAQALRSERSNDLHEADIRVGEGRAVAVGAEENRADRDRAPRNRHDGDRLHAAIDELVFHMPQGRVVHRIRDEHGLATLHRALELRVAVQIDDIVSNRRVFIGCHEAHVPPAPSAAPRTSCAQSASPAARSGAGGSVAAGPIGAYDVFPELPGMGRPADIAATTARRRALLQRIGRGTVLIPAAHERNIEQDYVQDNDFRQNNTFYYFTELETQDAWLLLTARGDTVETVLFLPPRIPAQERWTGLRLG